ncbi:glycosyltransferase family 2 protein [Methylosinus sp. LW4]|uniref:glycosyltransferase family 2 protein n=1 Tax=Methylosinus sp. LW4 TaxID=136993 RepID=UPI0018DEE454|nr:glycosyltransferase family 2 protein [Methylosinus sp. LW4]
MRIDAPPFKIVLVDNESMEPGIDLISQWADGLLSIDMSSSAWSEAPRERLREPTLSTWTAEGLGSQPQALITLIRVSDNTGFAAANNLGIRLALTDTDCTHVWLLNNDTIVDHRSLTALLDRVGRDRSIGVCGSTLLYYDTPKTIQSLGGVFDPVRGRGTNLGIGKPLQLMPTTEQIESRLEYVIGASMLVTRQFLEVVGLMEESYFLYFEELDWERRSHRRFKHAWARESFVYHKEGASLGTSSRGRPSDVSLYCFNLNFLKFLATFHPSLVPAGVIIVFFKSIVAVKKRDIDALRTFWTVMYDFLWTGHPTRTGLERFSAKRRATRGKI